MPIRLSAEIEARVRQKIEHGGFADEDEVIREALHLLDEQEAELAVLRAKLQIGLDQLARGEAVPFTAELLSRMRHEADERYRRGDQPNPDVTP